MKTPHISLIYQNNVDEKIFSDLINTINNEKLSIKMLSNDDEMIFAGMEWLMPTIVITYISKSYFDAFLKEMGKDHYQILKKGMILLWDKMINKAPQITLISGSSSQNKIKDNNPYSFYFSIIADADQNYKFKLLLDINSSFEEYTNTIEAFFDFLEKYHYNELDEEMKKSIKAISISSTILIKFDKELKSLDFITLEDIKNKKG